MGIGRERRPLREVYGAVADGSRRSAALPLIRRVFFGSRGASGFRERQVLGSVFLGGFQIGFHGLELSAGLETCERCGMSIRPRVSGGS